MSSDPITTKEPAVMKSPGGPEAAGLPDAGYRRSATIWVSPRALRWVVPAAVVGLFVCLFFPWTGAYPSGYPAYTQNAFQTIWGGVSVNAVATEALDAAIPYDNVGKDPLMLLYIFLLVWALVLVLAPLVLTPDRVQARSAILQSLWRKRLGLLGTTALAAFAVLMIQMWNGFGFEDAVAAKADQGQTASLAAAKTPEEREKANIHRGLEISPFNVRRTRWLHLAVSFNALVVGGVGLELWLKRRGATPLPRIDVHA
jgi:hypothetical protein